MAALNLSTVAADSLRLKSGQEYGCVAEFGVLVGRTPNALLRRTFLREMAELRTEKLVTEKESSDQFLNCGGRMSPSNDPDLPYESNCTLDGQCRTEVDEDLASDRLRTVDAGCSGS